MEIMSDCFVYTDHMTVGYQKKPLIRDICIQVKKGEILTLIGPNGAGKSTILKSMIGQLALLGGVVYLEQEKMQRLSEKEIAKKISVVMTERLRPELMTCEEVVSTGRYPHTGRLGILTEQDRKKVKEAMELVHALDLRERDFTQISDGQRQRILLARAICQEPEMIVLDEPTSFLDIRHKLELLTILKQMVRQKKVAVIMSLHELDLAQKISDKIVCVKGERISAFGTPEEIFQGNVIQDLYQVDNGFFDPCFGSIELPKPEGVPRVFVISSCGKGIPVYRRLQRENVPFAAGILYTNDVDYQVARFLAAEVVTAEPFEEISRTACERALKLLGQCERAVCPGVKIGSGNRRIEELIRAAREMGKLEEYFEADSQI